MSQQARVVSLRQRPDRHGTRNLYCDENGRVHENIDSTAEVAVVSLSGEFDLVNQAGVERSLARLVDMDRHLLVDLGGVTFLDGSIVRTLLALHRRATARGRRVVLRTARADVVERVLEITHVERAIPRVRTRSEGLAQLKGGRV